jgi:hypothetical protein
MYRDASTHLDEHDRAVGAIQIADGLIAECVRAAARMRTAERPERWRAAHLVHDEYPEIWRQLDLARRVLAQRGANTIGYDELRGEVRTVLPVRDDDDAPVIDTVALDDARRALDELRLAVPGADWRGIDKRTQKLVGTTLIRRGQRIAALSGIAIAFLLAVAAWTTASIPDRKADPREAMRKELAGVVEERHARIAQLEVSIGNSCEDRFRVHELMKLLVMDGRWQDARRFADDYEERCGEDVIVRKWANAPIPRVRY